jgi:hypothetical protein
MLIDNPKLGLGPCVTKVDQWLQLLGRGLDPMGWARQAFHRSPAHGLFVPAKLYRYPF